MSTGRKILGNTFIQFFGRIVSALLAIISVKVITSSLGLAGYGNYTTVYEFVGLFAIIGDLGLYTIAVREMAEKEDQIEKIYANVLTMRVLLTTIVMILVGIGGMFIPQYHGTLIPMGIWICTLAVWLNLFYSIVSSLLQFKLKMHYATIALIVGKTVGVAVTIFAAWFISNQNYSFYMMVASGIFGHGVMLLITLFFVSKYFPFRFAFDTEYWLYLIKKAWPYGLALILSTIYFKLDITMLSLMRNQEEVGTFGVALRMIEVLNVLPLFFMNSVLGTLTRAVKENEEQAKKVFSLSFLFLFVLTVPIFLGSWFTASDLIQLISSKEFVATAGNYGADSVFILLVIAMSIYFVSTLFSFSLVALNQQGKVLYVNAAGALLNLSLNLYIIPKYGFMGAAMVSILSELVVLAVSAFFVFRAYSFSLPWKKVVFILFLAVAEFFFLAEIFPFIAPFAPVLRVLFVGLLLGGTYFPILFFTNILDRSFLKRVA